MRLFSLSLVFALSLVSVAAADDAILIMDASRSMLGRVQGKRKVEIAREVVGELLGEIPKDRRLGFVAYGHRRAEDCNDIEEVVPVGNDRARIKSSLDALEVKGQTPLTAAVRFAADKLSYTKNKATVILVSDGIESCHADPCATGAELERAGVDLTVHVVGFGLKKSEIKGLKCLAEATGGMYLSANNAKELTRALEQTVAKKEAKDEPVDGSATLSAPARVLEGRKFDVSFTGPNNESDRISLARIDAKPLEWLDANGPRDARDGKVRLLAPAEPGVFELRYVHESGKIIAKAPLEVTAVEATLEGPTSVGAGGRIEVRWTAPAGEYDYVRLSKPEQEAETFATQASTQGKNGAETLTAPTIAGKYELRYLVNAKRIIARVPVEVIEVTAKLTAPTRVAAGAAFEVTWTGPSNDVDSLFLAAPGSGPGDWKSWAPTHDQNGRGELTAPLTPGKYEVRYVMAYVRILDRVTVEVTDVTATLRSPASAAAGSELLVAWTGPNYRTDHIIIARPGTNVQSWERWLDASTDDRTIDVPDKPGVYELRYVLGGERILASQPLVVH